MPEFIAVKCFDCATFQVAQVRKDKKFNCRMCTKKQSVIKVSTAYILYTFISNQYIHIYYYTQVYRRSNRAADCRKIVQELNMARGAAEEEFEAKEEPIHASNGAPGPVVKVEPSHSEWAPYVHQDIDTDMGDDDEDDEDTPTTALPDWSVGRTKRNRNAKRPRNTNDNSRGAKKRSCESAAGRGIRIPTENRDEYHPNQQQHQISNAHDTSMQTEFGHRNEPRMHPESNEDNNNNKSGGYVVDDGFLTTMGGDGAFEEEVYP